MKFSFEAKVKTINYSLRANITSGQMFRWFDYNDGVYLGISQDKACLASQDGDTVTIRTRDSESADYWINLLALEEDDFGLQEVMCITEPLIEVYNYSRGLRILRQDPWETLISFIISQRNNIPRIKECIEKVCWSTGEYLGEGKHAFPAPEVLKPIALSNCKLGYRESYIYAAADAVMSGSLRLNSISRNKCSLQEALQELCRVPGVGIKVANCVALFGLGHTDAFPVDVWIERAIENGLINYEMMASFGQYSGLVQQYIYYYMIHGGGRNV